MAATAVRSAWPSSAGSVISMAGTWTTSAPRRRRRCASDDACVRVRVTTTRRPNKGSRSNQPTSTAATEPTTMVDGAASSWSPSDARVARTVDCSGRVPHRTAAAGVSGWSPPAWSAAAIFGQRPTPISTTIVPPRRAAAAQSMEVSFVGSSWPVITVNDVEEGSSDTGMPAAAGAAIAEVTPGTTSKSIPASRSTVHSSAPRANTNGSPPSRRTTVTPRRPCSTMRSLMASWGTDGPPGVLPTPISSAPAGASSRRSATDSRS